MKKTKIIFAIAAIVLFGCEESTEYRVDHRVSPYVENFFSEGEKRGYVFKRDNLIIVVQKGVGDVNKYDGLRHQAYCHKDPETGQVTIRIDEDYVESESVTIECTIFHELGHGLLNRTHGVGVLVPSIMKGHYWTNYFYRDMKDELINELFENKGK